MHLWIKPVEAEEKSPGFFASRGENSWQVDPEQRRIFSRFGFAEVRVQTKPDGSPDFDRVVYGEAPNINAVVYGKDVRGNCQVAVVNQGRPFADMPDGTPADPPLIFGQPCVMGFLDKILGGSLANAYESADQGAIREAIEEAGSRGILSVSSIGSHNPNPTFCATWSNLFEIEVNLTTISKLVGSSELIHSAEYLPIKEIKRRIAVGSFGGVNYRSATANSAFFTWLCHHPDLDR